MEEQEILNLETGTKESTNLEPKIVKIVKVSVEEVGERKTKKAVFEVKHPDKEETIKISQVKYEKKGGQLEVSGTWVNLDDESKIRKGSALACLLSYLKVQNLNKTVELQVPTVEDEKGYLTFKAY